MSRVKSYSARISLIGLMRRTRKGLVTTLTPHLLASSSWVSTACISESVMLDSCERPQARIISYFRLKLRQVNKVFCAEPPMSRRVMMWRIFVPTGFEFVKFDETN